LNDEIATRSAAWVHRSIVTMHGSFGYYAERYDLNIAAIVEPFPGREPTPRYMAEVLEAVRASDARALFSEPQLDPRPARVIAQQANIALGELDPVGGSEGVDSYERLLRSNTEVLSGLLGD
jgi:ABC-type Zn uptake system ZnuABC Zn-binding protein ZnuA